MFRASDEKRNQEEERIVQFSRSEVSEEKSMLNHKL